MAYLKQADVSTTNEISWTFSAYTTMETKEAFKLLQDFFSSLDLFLSTWVAVQDALLLHTIAWFKWLKNHKKYPNNSRKKTQKTLKADVH